MDNSNYFVINCHLLQKYQFIIFIIFIRSLVFVCQYFYYEDQERRRNPNLRDFLSFLDIILRRINHR